MIHPSTFSIVAYDPQEAAWGIAVASKFLAVGAVVPWARAGSGAIATQSYANTSFGPNGLARLEQGQSAQQVLEALLADDPQADQRQMGIVDAQGGAATFTGQACHAWAGGVIQANSSSGSFAAQGNILVGPEVVQAMAEAFNSSSAELPWRLYRALLAGDQAGGDRRGRQSAAVYVVKAQAGYGSFNDRWIDYRVDDHPNPLQRLQEILELHDLYFQKSPPAEQVELNGEPLRRLQRLMSRLGYYHGSSHGNYDEATRMALTSFIGNENFEERTDFANGLIDYPVLEYLLRHFGEMR